MERIEQLLISVSVAKGGPDCAAMLSMSTGQQIPTDWREGRRLRAWELKQQGWSQQSIADALGVSPGAVSQWMRRAREGGVEGLKRRVARGPTPKLTDEQRAKLPLLLAQGAEAFGFRGDVWTAKRVTTVIRREFGVRYHPNHIGNLLRAAGWSVQKPVQRASQRNEAAIEAWRTERWPELKKGRTRKEGPSSGSTSPASTCCPAPSGPTPRAARRRSSASP
jgi:transposase